MLASSNQSVVKINKFLSLFLFVYFISNNAWHEAPLFVQSPTLDCIQKDSIPTRSHMQNKKPWTFIVYMAADNDLRAFAARNLKQLAAIGSNDYINIVVHLDIRVAGNQKITRRYYIEKNRILHVNTGDPKTERMDSGNPKTLKSCCKWAITQYPAEQYALIIWNHGTGVLDPARGRIINPVQLFSFNPSHNKFEVDRSIEFFEWIDHNQRGVCWDDTTGNYLTNQKLDQALSEIRQKYMNNEQFAFIAFDACLMAMLEMAVMIRKHAKIQISSEEVELGTGYNYAIALEPFNTRNLSPEEFARHIVHAYAQSYNNITNDYTQSAINLTDIEKLERNVHLVSMLLVQCIQNQRNNSVKNSIKKSRNKFYCTHFDEPRYIDLHHFYSNVRKNIEGFQLGGADPMRLIRDLKHALDAGMQYIQEIVLANVAGKGLEKARGISIYFPEDFIHPSYPPTEFATNNAWLYFLQTYLAK